MKPQRGSPRKTETKSEQPAGQASRRAAVFIVDAVTLHRRMLDEAVNEAFAKPGAVSMSPRDRAFARLIATTTLRRLGELKALLRVFMKSMPDNSGRLSSILTTSLAQLLYLDTPAHAVVSQAVDITRLDHHARRYDKLVNAVLRRATTEGRALLAAVDAPWINIPQWLAQRWETTFGAEAARAMTAAMLTEPPLDVSVKADAASWAERLGGLLLPGGSIRIRQAGRVAELPGFGEGAWWVQDAAAALPARLLGDVSGQSIADLCAAPGGKTAQIAAAGARVTAVDQSAKRLVTLGDNLARLQLHADLVASDIASFAATPERRDSFDGVLLDAPCSATGTVRRHPDLLHNKSETEIGRLAAVQAALLEAAAKLVRPGGRLVYCTCSLEPEEGEHRIADFLAKHADFRATPIDPGALNLEPALVTPEGWLRTRPDHSFGPEVHMRGMDGFFAARLDRA